MSEVSQACLNDIQVSTVANLIEVRERNTFFEYRLDDGSSRGSIVAKQWRSDALHYFTEDDCHNQYVRVIGKLSRYQNDSPNQLQVIHIREAPEANAVDYHQLQAMLAVVYFQRGPPPSSTLRQLRSLPVARAQVVARPHTPPSTANPTPMVSPAAPPTIHSPIQSPSQAAAPQSPSSIRSGSSQHIAEGAATSSARGTRRQSRRDPLSHLGAIERGIILVILNAPPSEDGVHVSQIARGIKHLGPTPQQVEGALDKLVDEQYIVDTIDPSHYKVTEKCPDNGEKNVQSARW
ncbi:hypothetical protein B0H21DRAFT_888375 [Amylocystis lapponica]|nr:hypothetical protein B0H21DRAFT_888375 [Amylocystis lapponica]